MERLCGHVPLCQCGWLSNPNLLTALVLLLRQHHLAHASAYSKPVHSSWMRRPRKKNSRTLRIAARASANTASGGTVAREAAQRAGQLHQNLSPPQALDRASPPGGFALSRGPSASPRVPNATRPPGSVFIAHGMFTAHGTFTAHGGGSIQRGRPHFPARAPPPPPAAAAGGGGVKARERPRSASLAVRSPKMSTLPLRSPKMSTLPLPRGHLHS